MIEFPKRYSGRLNTRRIFQALGYARSDSFDPFLFSQLLDSVTSRVCVLVNTNSERFSLTPTGLSLRELRKAARLPQDKNLLTLTGLPYAIRGKYENFFRQIRFEDAFASYGPEVNRSITAQDIPAQAIIGLVEYQGSKIKTHFLVN